MRSDAHCIEDLYIKRDKEVGARIYAENQHKPIRYMVPMDFSAKYIPVDKVKKDNSALRWKERKRISAMNTAKCIDYLVKHGPASTKEIAKGIPMAIPIVTSCLVGAKRKKAVRADTPIEGRHATIIWSIPGLDLPE